MPKTRISGQRWSVGRARAHLTELFEAAASAPQRVFRRHQPAAVVVSPAEFEKLMALESESGRPTIEDAFASLRADASVVLRLPKRSNRKNVFTDDLG